MNYRFLQIDQIIRICRRPSDQGGIDVHPVTGGRNSMQGVSGTIEMSPVDFVLNDLHEVRDRDDRALQVVRNGISELFEFLVASRQFVEESLALGFVSLTFDLSGAGSRFDFTGSLSEEDTLSGEFSLTAWMVVKDAVLGNWLVYRQ